MSRQQIILSLGGFAFVRLGGGGGAPVDADPRDCPPSVERGEDALDCPSAPTDDMHEAPEVDYGGFRSWRRRRYQGEAAVGSLAVLVVLFLWYSLSSVGLERNRLKRQVSTLTAKVEEQTDEIGDLKYKIKHLETTSGAMDVILRNRRLEDSEGSTNSLREELPLRPNQDSPPGN